MFVLMVIIVRECLKLKYQWLNLRPTTNEVDIYTTDLQLHFKNR